jgi:hypothetical protein
MSPVKCHSAVYVGRGNQFGAPKIRYEQIHRLQSLMDLAGPLALEGGGTTLIYCDLCIYIVQASYSQPDAGFSSEKRLMAVSCCLRF